MGIGMKWCGSFLVWLGGVVATACCAVEPAPIAVTIYADAGYPPYSYIQAGEAAGVYAEIMRKAFARMPRYRVTIEPVPWKRGLAFLESGRVLALYPPYRRTEERPWMTPYSEPLLEETVVVICRDDVLTQPRPVWPGDYFGLVIGSNSGYLGGGENFRRAVVQGKLAYQEAGTSQQNIMKLLAGRLDCYINDRQAILWEYQRLRRQGPLAGDHPGALVEGAVISSEYGYLGFAHTEEGRFPFKKDFLNEFDAVIRTMRANGEIAAIVEPFMRR